MKPIYLLGAALFFLCDLFGQSTTFKGTIISVGEVPSEVSLHRTLILKGKQLCDGKVKSLPGGKVTALHVIYRSCRKANVR